MSEDGHNVSMLLRLMLLEFKDLYDNEWHAESSGRNQFLSLRAASRIDTFSILATKSKRMRKLSSKTCFASLSKE